MGGLVVAKRGDPGSCIGMACSSVERASMYVFGEGAGRDRYVLEGVGHQ